MKSTSVAILLLTTSLAANASIDQSLESVCATTSEATSVSFSSATSGEQQYQAKLSQVYSASSCNGRELINSMRLSSHANGEQNEQQKNNIVRSGD